MANGYVGEGQERKREKECVRLRKKKKGARILRFSVNITDGFSVSN